MRSYSLYIFDLDGTLVDSSKGQRICCEYALGRMGYRCKENGSDTFADSPAAVFRKFDDGRYRYGDFVRYFREEAGRSMDANSIPFPDAKHTVLSISDKGLPMCVATRKTEAGARAVLKNYNLDAYFDHIIGSDSVVRQKPDPECLLKCMSFYPISKENTVFIGDTPDDMRTAEAAGIDGILIDRSGNAENTACVRCIRSLTELLK